MSAMHTPGPWFPEFTDSRACHASVRTGKNADGFMPWVCHMQTVDIDVGNANARLIAAAPEMLKALIEAWPWIITDRNTFAECARARGIAAGADDFSSDDKRIVDGYDDILKSIESAVDKATGNGDWKNYL